MIHLVRKRHWFRYEYEGRGSIHCHGTAKLNNDPGLGQLTQTALKGFLAQKFKDENDCSDTTELDQDIEAGQNAADTVCQYVDWLLSTVNPDPPDEDMWTVSYPGAMCCSRLARPLRGPCGLI